MHGAVAEQPSGRRQELNRRRHHVARVVEVGEVGVGTCRQRRGHAGRRRARALPPGPGDDGADRPRWPGDLQRHRRGRLDRRLRRVLTCPRAPGQHGRGRRGRRPLARRGPPARVPRAQARQGDRGGAHPALQRPHGEPVDARRPQCGNSRLRIRLRRSSRRPRRAAARPRLPPWRGVRPERLRRKRRSTSIGVLCSPKRRTI